MTGAGGLRYDPSDDDALDTLRRQAQSMSRNLHVDMDQVGTFALGSPDMTGMSNGLLAADDPETLAELLRDQRDREADLRLRRSLERAERAADREEYDAAVALVDQALEVDRTSVSAWLLRGRCLMATDDFAQARQAIAVAGEHARGHAETQLADAMTAACDKQEMRRFTDRLTELIARGRVAEARRQVQRRLDDRPDDATLLRNHCALLLLSDEVAVARRVAEQALRRVDRSDAGTFEDLLRTIARRECEPRIDDARQALRRGDTATAVARLDECVAALGDDERFAVLRSYASARHVDAVSSALRRRWRRRRDDDVAPISPEDLQWILEWLAREELAAGWAAFQAGDFRAAQEEFAEAASIDGRCARVAYLHAAALFRGLVERLGQSGKPDLDEAHRILVTAKDLSAQCASDSVVGEASAELGRTVGQILAVVERVQAQIARTQEVNRCVTRFNSLFEHYQKHPIRTPEQRETARRSFHTLAEQVDRLREQDHADSDPEERALLSQLASVLAEVRRSFGRR